MLENPDKPQSRERTFAPEHLLQEGREKHGVDTTASKAGMDASASAAKKFLPDVSFFDSSQGGSSKSMDLLKKGPGSMDWAQDRLQAKPAEKGSLENTLGNGLTDRVIGAVSGNEGKFHTLTKNDNGHGISVGIRQWNQKTGELPDLLKSFHDKNPEKFDQTFGKYAQNLQNERWVRHANMAGNPDLMNKMRNALNDPEFQQVQVDKAREFTARTIETAKNFGFHSDLGKALVTDLSNQLGEAGARNLMRRAGLRSGGTIENEEATIHRLTHMSRRQNNHSRFELLADSFSPERRPPTPRYEINVAAFQA